MGNDQPDVQAIHQDLRAAMEKCAEYADDVAAMTARFGPAQLSRGDFSLAPGSDEVATAYVSGTKDSGNQGRYTAIMGYLEELRAALGFVGVTIAQSTRNYQAGHDASTLRTTP
ncbi:hypothetical protein [Nonomuraea sp. NPDC046570]|uniref:hypothetical protein n=1 Tax=Nonomuraea sp. NPDC046570 TaxID=3155255 RepID=UPI0034034B15